MAKKPKQPAASAPAPRAKKHGARGIVDTVRADSYEHPEAKNVMRPEAGQQATFKKRRAPKTYAYDSSLDPALSWDGQNAARERGEALIRAIQEAKTLGEARAAADQLAALSQPFLNWSGKAERLSFDVPTLPLFVHEKLSTEAIIDTLRHHRRDEQEGVMSLDLFGDEQKSIRDRHVGAYEHQGAWVNRMVLGDSLVVMSSLLEYEGMGGQVQMIYIDPPYGVKFGSNFQPFVRKRDVKHNDDGDMTREPEMVQAYRDTWELGLHSYLTYLRDRLLVARELLTESGSVFVQISDENLHHVREIVEEVFGASNFVSVISFLKTSALNSPDAKLTRIATNNDYLVWYAKDLTRMKFRQVYRTKGDLSAGVGSFDWIDLPDGTRRPLSKQERLGEVSLPDGRLFARADPTSQKPTTVFDFRFEDKTYNPLPRGWRTTQEGMARLLETKRLFTAKNSLRYVQYLDDFAVTPYGAFWEDTGTGSFTDDKLYVVQTGSKIVQRCIAMTTDPGDLVLDPTCGSGTTAYVAEQWGRRWITIDTSRVPLALARQRLLTATYPWYDLNDDRRGPAGGFVYKRKQNKKGEEVGGIVPHVTLKSVANDEPPTEEVLVDRPEIRKNVVRVSGPFWVEATIPTPVDVDEDGTSESPAAAEEYATFAARMVEVLRRSPVLRLDGGRQVQLFNVRPPARSLSLSAEAMVEASAAGRRPSLADVVDEAEARRGDRLDFTRKPVAFVFGPENGAVSEKLVHSAARESHLKGYSHLYVIGFAIQPSARELVESCETLADIPATYVQATPDLMMGDLLKTTRASQLFSVCGLPDVAIRHTADGRYQVELLGYDVFDPVTMDIEHHTGSDVPCWLLDVNYNDQVFHVAQAFFPRTGAWDNLKKAFRADYDAGVWDHLSGAVSAPFEAASDARVAVKVIDDRGNELLVVRPVSEADHG